MILDSSRTTPIYMQIAEWLEGEILKGHFQPHEKIYSQYQLADMFNINPATAAKGLNLLAEQKILYDRRGLGKFVAEDALSLLKEKRKNEVLSGLLERIVKEAIHLDISNEELFQRIQEMRRKMEGEEG